MYVREELCPLTFAIRRRDSSSSPAEGDRTYVHSEAVIYRHDVNGKYYVRYGVWKIYVKLSGHGFLLEIAARDFLQLMNPANMKKDYRYVGCEQRQPA